MSPAFLSTWRARTAITAALDPVESGALPALAHAVGLRGAVLGVAGAPAAVRRHAGLAEEAEGPAGTQRCERVSEGDTLSPLPEYNK